MLLNKARKLRKLPTKAEQLMWYLLRRHTLLGYKFKRQQPLGPYIVDFVCFQKKVIIELDGGHHAEQVNYDLKRQRWLESQGFKVLRYWNNDVLGNTKGVLEVLSQTLESRERI